MKKLLLCMMGVLAACGSDENGDDSEMENEPAADNWWFEIDVLDFDRGEGSVLVIVGNQIEAKSVGDNGEFSLTGLEPSVKQPGSYEAISILGFKDEKEPQRRCLAGDPTIMLEVASSEPFEATFSGTVECWEGDELLPEDPVTGDTLPSTVGNVTGYVYQK